MSRLWLTFGAQTSAGFAWLISSREAAPAATTMPFLPETFRHYEKVEPLVTHTKQTVAKFLPETFGHPTPRAHRASR